MINNNLGEEKNKIFKSLDQAITNIVQNSISYKNFLEIQSRFPQFSTNNAILVLNNMPNATLIKDELSWNRMGIFRKRNAKRIPIIIPNGNYWNIKNVYDISQTTSRNENVNNKNFNDREILSAFLKSTKFKIKTMESKTGEDLIKIDYDQQLLSISRNSGNTEKLFENLAMALSKIELQDLEESKYKEFHVKSSAYAICKRYQINTSNFDFSEVNDIYKNMEPRDIRNDLSISRKVIDDITNVMDQLLEKGEKNKNREQER